MTREPTSDSTDAASIAPRVAVLCCEKLPGFVTMDLDELDELFSDDRMLVAELGKRGAQAELVAWTDTSIDWNDFDLAVIRSTWDYIDDRERFVTVLERIDASSCALHNPLDIVRWNTDKAYLLDLEKWGVPIVPTIHAAGSDAEEVQAEVVRRGWADAIVKPRVGAGGSGVTLVSSSEVAAALARLVTEIRGAEFLVQPLAESVRTEGELSFVYIDGVLNHVLLKTPAPGDFRSHGIYGGTMQAIHPAKEDREQADAMMRLLPFRPLYTRLDLVRFRGQLVVMELELIEPILYFDFAPDGAGRLAAAALARVQGGGRRPVNRQRVSST